MSSSLTDPLTLPAPFPGLRAFEPEESLLFFGRETHSEELLRRLGSHRFLAVVGPSGCGKSSLIKAGLLPALHRGYLVGATSRWKLATMRPGPGPLDAMASAVAGAVMTGGSIPAIRAALGATTSGLVGLLRDAHLERGESFLLLVDQFEEIFRYSDDADDQRKADDAALFVGSLLAAVEQSDVPIYVVITMRSDFLGDCAAFPGLPEALNRSQYLVPRLTRDQRREAIVRPLRLVGSQPSDPLVQTVLNDVGDDPDQLPVLQHALLRTFRYWEGRGSIGIVDIPHYRAAGGIGRALNDHAGEVLSSVGADNLKLAERVFRALTTTDKGRTIRRPRELGRLQAIVGAQDDDSRRRVNQIVDRFARREHSLLLLSSSVLSTGTVVDIAHESLIRKWDTLRTWAHEEQKSADWLRDLATGVVRRTRGEGALWEDPNLSHVVERKQREGWNQAWTEQYCSPKEVAFADIEAFLDESSRTQEAARRHEEAQRQRELDDARALATARRRMNGALGLLLVTLVAAAALFYETNRRSKRAADSAAETLAVVQKQQDQAAGELRDMAAQAQQVQQKLNEATGPERTKLLEELRALQDKGTSAEQDAERLRKQLSGLQAQGPLKGTDNSALLSRIESLQKEVAYLSFERNRSQASLPDNKADSSATRLQEATSALQAVTKERDDARTELTDVRATLTQAQKSLDALRNEVADLRKRLESPVPSAATATPAASLPSGLYTRALNAFDRKQWAEAANLFEAAAKQLGDTKDTVKISSLRYEQYLPNYRLGLAYKELGRCGDAVAAWALSEQQGAIQGTPEHKRLQENRAACSPKK